jgi:glycosyltransferase involved in cell wall biosynthesis
MKRILFVVNVDWFFLSHRLPLARGAKELGYEVHVAATPSRAGDMGNFRDFKFHPIDVHRGGASPVKDLLLLGSLVRLYRRLKPDIVHHVTSKPIIYGSIAARLTGVNGIINSIPGLGLSFSVTGRRASLRKYLITKTYRLALPRKRTRVIFQNSENRKFFVNSKLVDPKDAVLIRGAGVDLDEYPAVPEPGQPLVVVLASRMLNEKGVPEFVEAGRLLLRRGIKAKFLLVGRVDNENPDHIPASQLEDWVKAGWVEWHGHRSDMANVFRETHIVCLPTNYGEGVPKVLIEAAASARPVVTTDVPGCRDIVRDGWNGLLVPPKNSEALASALAELLQDSAMRRRMGRNGRMLVEREFGVVQVVAETMATYEELLSEGAG